MLMNYFANVRPVDTAIVQQMIGWKEERKEDSWKKIYSTKDRPIPGYVSSTKNSRIKVKGYVAPPKPEPMNLEKIFPTNNRCFFRLERHSEYNPHGLTLPKEVGIDLAHLDDKGWPLLQWAAHNDTTPIEVFEMLIAAGCKVNVVQGENWTPLRLYLYKQRDKYNPAVLNLFLNAGFDTSLLPKADFAQHFITVK